MGSFSLCLSLLSSKKDHTRMAPRASGAMRAQIIDHPASLPGLGVHPAAEVSANVCTGVYRKDRLRAT